MVFISGFAVAWMEIVAPGRLLSDHQLSMLSRVGWRARGLREARLLRQTARAALRRRGFRHRTPSPHLRFALAFAWLPASTPRSSTSRAETQAPTPLQDIYIPSSVPSLYCPRIDSLPVRLRQHQGTLTDGIHVPASVPPRTNAPLGALPPCHRLPYVASSIF
jgi:hypothetical protein